MKSEIIAIFGIYLGFIVLEVIFSNFASKPGQRPKDAIVEIISTIGLTTMIQPIVIGSSAYLASLFMPQFANRMVGLNFLFGFGLFLIFDDLMQYWWHRLSHNSQFLYSLHRPHHDANYMSVRIVYRNNLFYYAFMPSLWFDGILIFMGLGWVYAIYVVMKMIVIISAHSDVRWDTPLYKIPAISPLMRIIECLISTPTTHSAHHGKYSSDEGTYYKGNYGNFLFLWDVLFGTAKINRILPKEFGVENLPEVGIGEQLIWPIIRTKRQTRI